MRLRSLLAPHLRSTNSMSLMSAQLCLLFSFFVLKNLLFFVTAQNRWCYDDGNYASNSTYGANLNALLSDLPAKMNDTGFYSTSLGQDTDRANAMVLCNSDIQLDACRTCVQNATVQLVDLCPNRKRAILWRDVCVLRYSDAPIVGLADQPAIFVWNTANVTSPDRFNENRRTLVDGLRVQAASGGSLMKVAAGNHAAPDFQTIYAMLQCTLDLSAEDCNGCLNAAFQHIPQCCPNSRAVTILLPSCNLRYDISPFYNITRIQEAQGTLSVPAPVPVPALVRPVSSPPVSGGNTARIVVIIVVPVVATLMLVACIAISIRVRIKKIAEKTISSGEDISVAESLKYDFGKIRAATNDFSNANKLGQGGFGAVYRGKLENEKEIAVKRLTPGSKQGEQEFQNEVLLMAKLRHKNLVRLIGFAQEGIERLLIYEFMENASLDQFIFDPIQRFRVDWERRYRIIQGIARGLLYLHEDSRLRIIHRDLNASNILLDRELNPKIADFGTAKVFEQEKSEGSTSRIMGTYGYMAPEYVIHGRFSVKLDVFSFGVLVLEIVSGQKNNSFHNGDDMESMLSFAWRNWQQGATINMIDPILRPITGYIRDMMRCIHIGLLCVQQKASDRPTMASVVLMLNSYSITLPLPSQPGFLRDNGIVPNASPSKRIDPRELSVRKSSKSASINDVSNSELYPR